MNRFTLTVEEKCFLVLDLVMALAAMLGGHVVMSMATPNTGLFWLLGVAAGAFGCQVGNYVVLWRSRRLALREYRRSAELSLWELPIVESEQTETQEEKHYEQ